MASALDIALGLAARGFPVFPCSVKKRPAIGKKLGGNGFHDATANVETVQSLWRQVAAPLVGVPTGAISGFDVLDIDYRSGGKEWEDANAHRLPETRIHQTMSGGRHYVFRHAPGVRNSASKVTLAAGIDVRGDGGYVIFPPSPGYLVVNDAEPAHWPDWLLELVLTRPMGAPKTVAVDTVAFTSKRLDALQKSILARVSSAPDGQKHIALRNAALSMGGIIQAAGITADQAVRMLMGALPSTVKDWKNAETTALWGVERGMAAPLELPDREAYQPRYTNGHDNHAQTNGRDAPTRLNDIHPPIEKPKSHLIRVYNGLRHVAADQAIQAMVDAGTEFYQRANSLVRAATGLAKTSDGKTIETPVIIGVTNPMLARAMGQSAEWEKIKADGTIVRIDPPKEVVEQVAAMSGSWPFVPLVGIISTPTMRPDGTLLTIAGYDDATGFLLIAPPKMPLIPECPTKHQAEDALDILCELLIEFPFADDVSRSVALSMILTTVLRCSMPKCPMHVATAPQPGTGKSYLADIASAIGTGEYCPVIAMAPNPEETEKRLIGAALSGQTIIAIDNVSEMMMGDFLNQVTERPVLLLRRLGSSDQFRIPNTFIVFANGNNLSAPADLVRRTLICGLDANLERPEDRVFQSNPVQTVIANRGKYVAAALTIARAYVVAGYPDRLNPLPSFERWSDIVRSALVWLKMPDPCRSMELARAEDPIRAARAALFLSWEREIGINPHGMTTGDMVASANASAPTQDGYELLHPQFREACIAVASERDGKTISTRRLGKYLAAAEKNKIGDLKLTADRSDPTRVRWVLSQSAP